MIRLGQSNLIRLEQSNYKHWPSHVIDYSYAGVIYSLYTPNYCIVNNMD